MSSWKECKLGDIAEINMGQSPKSEFYNQDKIGLPFLQGNRTFGLKYPYFDTYCSEPTKIAKHGEILFSVRAPVGDINIANDEICIGRGLCSINSKDKNNEFLYYLLHFLKNEIINNESGSVFGSINRTDLSNINVLYPPIEEQKAIAEVLSSLDDKIDLLHRQNQTLESLAQTLFTQWFIEEAKEEWEEKPLSKIADFLNGLACQKFPPQNDIDKLPVLKIKDLKDGISENSDYSTSDVKPEYIVNNGDVIFAWSASLMVKIWDGEKCVLNQHLFKVTSKDFPKWFYYHWCKYHLDNFIAISSEHATTMGHIKRGDLDEAICIIPSSEELVKMDEQISPIFDKLEINSKQIKSLEEMRDTLLPKLLSGEVRVEI